MNVLLVEDDVYKSDDLVATFFLENRVTIAQSVKDAVRAVDSQCYDLVVLDMALPTFKKEVKSAGGTTQASGGVEVIRAIQRTRIAADVLIVSQYPDVELEGKYLSLGAASRYLASKYGVHVIGAVRYDDKSWVSEFQQLIEGSVK